MRNASLHTSDSSCFMQGVSLILHICEANASFTSDTSIGANIREAQYAHGKADFISKLQIALKEASETGYWLELLYKTNYIDETTYKELDSACTSIRVMLISSVNTVKSKQ